MQNYSKSLVLTVMKDPQPRRVETIDTLKLVTSTEFAIFVDEVEAKLLEICGDDANYDGMVEYYESELNKELGEWTGYEANASGSFYICDEDDEIINTLPGHEIVGEQFAGVFIRALAGKPRVMLMFQISDYYDELDKHVPSKTVCALPAELDSFEIITVPDAELIDIFDDLTHEVALLIRRGEFLKADRATQDSILEAVLQKYEEKIHRRPDDVIELDAERFICQFKEFDFLSLDQCVTDQSELKPHERIKMRGNYVGLSLPNMSVGAEPYRHVADFTLFGGVPCLKLYNRVDGMTIHAPLDQIRKLKTI